MLIHRVVSLERRASVSDKVTCHAASQRGPHAHVVQLQYPSVTLLFHASKAFRGVDGADVTVGWIATHCLVRSSIRSDLLVQELLPIMIQDGFTELIIREMVDAPEPRMAAKQHL